MHATACTSVTAQTYEFLNLDASVSKNLVNAILYDAVVWHIKNGKKCMTSICGALAVTAIVTESIE